MADAASRWRTNDKDDEQLAHLLHASQGRTPREDAHRRGHTHSRGHRPAHHPPTSQVARSLSCWLRDDDTISSMSAWYLRDHSSPSRQARQPRQSNERSKRAKQSNEQSKRAKDSKQHTYQAQQPPTHPPTQPTNQPTNQHHNDTELFVAQPHVDQVQRRDKRPPPSPSAPHSQHSHRRQ